MDQIMNVPLTSRADIVARIALAEEARAVARGPELSFWVVIAGGAPSSAEAPHAHESARTK